MNYEDLKKRELIFSILLFIGYSRLFEGVSLHNIALGIAMTITISIIPGWVAIREIKKGNVTRGILLASLIEFLWTPIFKLLNIQYWWHFLGAGILGLATVLWLNLERHYLTLVKHT